jgi:hypothetical protein
MSPRRIMARSLQDIQPFAAPYEMLHSLQQFCQRGRCQAGSRTRQNDRKPKPCGPAPRKNGLQLLCAWQGCVGSRDVILLGDYYGAID